MLRRFRNLFTSSTDSESTGSQPNSTEEVITLPVAKQQCDNAATTFVVPSNPSLGEIRMLDLKVAALSLNKMLEKGFFSICEYKKCQKLLKVHMPKATMDRLNVLHCVDFSAMPPDVLGFVEAACRELFHAPPIDLTGLVTIDEL